MKVNLPMENNNMATSSGDDDQQDHDTSTKT
eukprot:CAMPEP_0118802368 /NCGR_PEP_ID=MMETSP1161-20130426/7182_1 /TAXON_ID=249345 /ORGANISM="Picochlorum oklahomensis, Strain CCMP2329" /LENGTH=30 /DNA_ID= /DNA_START= /DNA_END= /DNA_ORIENTATION=